jgi:hypothetical protein
MLEIGYVTLKQTNLVQQFRYLTTLCQLQKLQMVEWDENMNVWLITRDGNKSPFI